MIRWICDYLPPINLWNVWKMNDKRVQKDKNHNAKPTKVHDSKKKNPKEECINYEIDEYYEQRKRN